MIRMTRRALFILALCFATCLAEPKVDIQVLEEGVGPSIEIGEEAKVLYRLELVSGKLVDEANIHAPYLFVVGSENVLPGMSQGVQGMKVGGRRQVAIPPELGYGDRDLGTIPANSTLNFTIELLEIKAVVVEAEEKAVISDEFQKEEFLSKRHAAEIKKPAMFEYLIRDFFTKPWRYEDGHKKIWGMAGKVFVIFIFASLWALVGRRKGWWIL